jgi:hypothetical protein
MFWFRFPDWDSPEEKAEYTKYKEQSQRDLRAKFEQEVKLRDQLKKTSRAEIAFGRICNYLLWKHDTNFIELGKISGYSDTRVKDLVIKYVDLFASNELYANQHSKTHFPEEYGEYTLNQYRNKAHPDVL